MADLAASTSCRSGIPDRVLLDRVTHMGRCRNATTAITSTSGGCHIEVSFALADPPSLTRCVIDCPHLPCGSFFENPPHITGADGAFLLITAIFPKHPDRSHPTDLFVYNSGGSGKPPSLQLLPHPYPLYHLSNHIGVLSCGENHCLVVIPQRQFDADGVMNYVLHIFSSETGLWSTKVAKLAPGMEPYCGRFEPSKAFSVGEGSMAWVDLRYGILLFESVDNDNPAVWRRIELPPLMPINIKNQGEGFDGLLPGLDKIRDVIYSNGWFRFIEIGFFPLIQLNASRAPPRFYWQAAMFKRKVRADDHQGWCPHGPCCGVVDSAGFSPADSCVPYLFPEIYKNKKLALDDVLSLYPTLDPNYEGVVYMMTKLEDADPNGWVLALNTNFKKLVMIAPFSAERLLLHRSDMPLPCAFSKHLSRVSGACNTNGWKHNIIKEDWMPLVLCAVPILLAQQKFRQLEKYFTEGRPSRDVVRSLLHSGVAATSAMNVHIRRVTQYAISIGVGKAASDAAETFQRASKDVENVIFQYCSYDPAAHGKAVGDKINVAVGALEELLHTLPSIVLDTGRSMLPDYESFNEEIALR